MLRPKEGDIVTLNIGEKALVVEVILMPDGNDKFLVSFTTQDLYEHHGIVSLKEITSFFSYGSFTYTMVDAQEPELLGEWDLL